MTGVIMTGVGAATEAVAEVGLSIVAVAGWPEADADTVPPAPPGFVASSFSPLVAAVVDRCLRRATGGEPGTPTPVPRDTGIVLASRWGDVASAVRVATSVDGGTRLGPLAFFQAVPNAVLGHLAARWGLTGPVVCTSPVADPLRDALGVAELLIADDAATDVLVVVADQSVPVADGGEAFALLVTRPGHAVAAIPEQPGPADAPDRSGSQEETR